MDDKPEDNRRYKRKSESDISGSKHKRRSVEETGHSSRRSPPIDDFNDPDSKDRHKHRHKSRHKHRETSGHKENDRSHRQHRSKHSHHSKSKTGTDDSAWSGAPQKILRDHTSYADITPLDSKEIYAEGRDQLSALHLTNDFFPEGDRIVINVNFKRDNVRKSADVMSPVEKEQSTKADQKDTPSKERRASSKKDDSIFWASPPPQNQTTTTSGPTTTVITRIEDDLSSNHSNRSLSSNSDQKTSEKSDKDSKGLEDLRFLPRGLDRSSSDPLDRSLGPHTPEGEYCEDQFMPTPTQDESRSPELRSPSLSPSGSRSSLTSPRSPSPTVTTNGSKDDVYDPEAPLQSPDSHQTKTVTRRPDPKSPDIPTNRVPAKRSPPPDTRRKTSGSSLDVHSREPPKSTANRSPFGHKSSQSLQQSKPSPQKPAPVHHKSGSSQLMPPPSAPTSRPTQPPVRTNSAFGSINAQHLAQLLQMAQALNAKRQAQSGPAQQQHKRPSASTKPSATARQSATRPSATRPSAAQNNNKDRNEVVDMDIDSPSPPGPQQPTTAPQQPRVTSTTGPTTTAQVQNFWDQLIKTKASTQQASKPGTSGQKKAPVGGQKDGHRHQSGHSSHRHQVVSVASDHKKQLTAKGGNKLDQLTVLDDVPSSAVEMAVKEKVCPVLSVWGFF